jgi:hypothetical protein
VVSVVSAAILFFTPQMKNQPAAKQQYMYDRDAIKTWSLVWAKQSAYRNVGLRDGADPRTLYGLEAPPSSIVHASLCRKCQHKSAPDPDIADSWWEVRLRRIGHRKLVSAMNASAYWRQTGYVPYVVFRLQHQIWTHHLRLSAFCPR